MFGREHTKLPKRSRRLLAAGAMAIGLATSTGAVGIGSAHAEKADLVASVVAAPVTPDGTVAGRTTDVVVNLSGSMDPAVPGRSLLAGRQIRIQLPAGMAPVEPSLPFLPPTSPGCPLPPAGTPLGTCNVVVLLQGWPQRPILPFTAASAAYDSATNEITITANQDILASPPAAPGIKQIHLLLSGFRNPHAGRHPLRVEAETGPGGSLESGSGTVHVVPRERPSIAITSAFNAGRPSPIYQETSALQEAPVPYDLLLWDEAGIPLTDVAVVKRSPHLFQLAQGAQVIGRITVSAPPGATDQELLAAVTSFAIAAPVTGVPTARLNVRFRAGSLAGDYTLTFALAGENDFQTVVRVR